MKWEKGCILYLRRGTILYFLIGVTGPCYIPYGLEIPYSPYFPGFLISIWINLIIQNTLVIEKIPTFPRGYIAFLSFLSSRQSGKT